MTGKLIQSSAEDGEVISSIGRCGVFLGLVLAIGCGKDAKQKQTPEQLKGRLDAAIGITDPSKRNDALQSVAEDAAEAGVGEVAQAAAERITDPSRKNNVAAACALKLAERGDTKGATTVAGLITDPSRKNDVLGKIAK
jgi:hypothetical protein